MFGKRLRELRENNGYSMDKLAELYNSKFNGKMNKSTLSRYENGLQEPMYGVVVNLSKLFNVSVDYMTSGNVYDYFKSPETTEDYVTFPVIGEIAAGYDHEAIEDWGGDTIDVPSSYLKGRDKTDFFVLNVTGNSMYPLYQEGDNVLILKQTVMDYSGQVGAVLYDGTSATLKKVEFPQKKDWIKLIPINPEYPPKTIDGYALEDVRILGIPKLLVRET